MHFIRERGLFPEPQKSGVITCIAREDKCRTELNNWRTITLLNSVRKFYSGILTQRIKNVLDKIINDVQEGLINGRCIGENASFTSDIIRECEIQNMNGLIVIYRIPEGF